MVTVWIWVRRMAAAAVVFVLAACSSLLQDRGSGHARMASTAVSAPETVAPSTVSSTPPSAVAPTGPLPREFPELGGFAVADSGPYKIHQRGGVDPNGADPEGFDFVVFSPEGSPGIVCSLTMTKLPRSTAQANCTGEIPGAGNLPPPERKPGRGCEKVSVGATDAQPGSIARVAGMCRPQGGGVAFPADHKITFGKTTCAVGKGSVVACVIEGANEVAHGFVISQQKTWAF